MGMDSILHRMKYGVTASVKKTLVLQVVGYRCDFQKPFHNTQVLSLSNGYKTMDGYIGLPMSHLGGKYSRLLNKKLTNTTLNKVFTGVQPWVHDKYIFLSITQYVCLRGKFPFGFKGFSSTYPKKYIHILQFLMDDKVQVNHQISGTCWNTAT